MWAKIWLCSDLTQIISWFCGIRHTVVRLLYSTNGKHKQISGRKHSNMFPVNYCDKLIKKTLVRYTIRLTCSNKQGERNHLVYCNIANYHLNKNDFFVILASMEHAMRVWRKQSFLKESINHFSSYVFFSWKNVFVFINIKNNSLIFSIFTFFLHLGVKCFCKNFLKWWHIKKLTFPYNTYFT